MYSSSMKTYFVRTILLGLFLVASSELADGFNESEALKKLEGRASDQKPKICQIYSKATTKHIQIKKKIWAAGADGNKWSILEKKSEGFGGIVTIRGVESDRYLCMTRKGKLVSRAARKKIDKSCRFIENITATFFFTFRSEAYPKWYIGFNRKGRPKKKSKNTGKNHHFLIRYKEEAQEIDSAPPHIQRAAEDFQRRIQQNFVLKRPRRHRLQTEDPIGEEIAEQPVPDWINQKLSNASPGEQTEWLLRAKNWYSLLPSRASNSTMSSFEVDNMEVATSKPEKSRRKKQRKPKSNSPKSSRKKRPNKITEVGAQPTSATSRRRQAGETSIPKTPVQFQTGDEPTEPPRISSPKLSQMPKSHHRSSRRRHRTGINSDLDANTVDGPDEVVDCSNTDDFNFRLETKASGSHKDTMSLTDNTSGVLQTDSVHARRARPRRTRTSRPRLAQ